MVHSKEKNKASWLSWLERRPVTAEVAGSSPAGVVRNRIRDHSSAGRASALQAEGHRFEPYWSHSLQAGVAELADAQDLKSCCRNTVPVRFRSPALRETLIFQCFSFFAL